MQVEEDEGKGGEENEDGGDEDDEEEEEEEELPNEVVTILKTADKGLSDFNNVDAQSGKTLAEHLATMNTEETLKAALEFNDKEDTWYYAPPRAAVLPSARAKRSALSPSSTRSLMATGRCRAERICSAFARLRACSGAFPRRLCVVHSMRI